MYLIHSVSGPSGGARIILEDCWRLQERGHDVSLLTLDGSTSCGWYPASNIKILGRSLLEATARRADVIVATEANTAPTIMNLETNAKRFYRIQMRESLFHLNSAPVWSGQIEETYRKAKGILQPIVISQWLKGFLEDEYGYENVPIVPNGVNLQMFFPEPIFEKPEGKKRVLIEGFSSSEAKDARMMAYKTIDAYRQRYPGTIELWGFSQASCYADFDRYWKWPNQDLIRQLYSSCDILLKASVYEGRSCVDPECWACGGAAVCRAITPGCGDDDLCHEHNCLRVKYGDFQGFYDNFIRLMTDEELRKRLVENGLKYVIEKLDWDSKIDVLERIYEGD